MKEEFAGYISKITLPNGKTYKLRCEIVQVHPMTCPKCGGNVTLHYGQGKCDYCGTNYSAIMKIKES